VTKSYLPEPSRFCMYGCMIFVYLGDSASFLWKVQEYNILGNFHRKLRCSLLLGRPDSYALPKPNTYRAHCCFRHREFSVRCHMRQEAYFGWKSPSIAMRQGISVWFCMELFVFFDKSILHMRQPGFQILGKAYFKMERTHSR
jgi:hypothetical protein